MCDDRDGLYMVAQWDKELPTLITSTS
jgi:hypothetical protein